MDWRYCCQSKIRIRQSEIKTILFTSPRCNHSMHIELSIFAFNKIYIFISVAEIKQIHPSSELFEIQSVSNALIRLLAGLHSPQLNVNCNGILFPEQ